MLLPLKLHIFKRSSARSSLLLLLLLWLWLWPLLPLPLADCRHPQPPPLHTAHRPPPTAVDRRWSMMHDARTAYRVHRSRSPNKNWPQRPPAAVPRAPPPPPTPTPTAAPTAALSPIRCPSRFRHAQETIAAFARLRTYPHSLLAASTPAPSPSPIPARPRSDRYPPAPQHLRTDPHFRYDSLLLLAA